MTVRPTKTIRRRTVLKGMLATGASAATLPMPAIAQGAPFKIGLLTVKTGPLAQGGIQMEQGIVTLLKEKNYTLAGRKVELLVADTGGNPAGARTKAQEVIERDKVNVILGPLAAFELLAITDYVRDNATPLIRLAAAEDVTIEVFMQVYSHAVGYHPDRGTPTGWLLTLARNRAIDRRRADANRAEREDPIEATAPLVASDPDPEEASSAAERRRLAREALAALAPEQRQVIEIAYFTGQSHGDIAARLGLPLGTVKTRIRTGMARLRSLLAPLGAEEER